MAMAGEPQSGPRPSGPPGREPSASAVFAVAVDLVQHLGERQTAAIESAGALVAARLMSGGTGYVFGTGHSRCVAMELAGRAGGLALMKELVLDDLVTAGLASKQDLLDGTLERRPEAALTLLDGLRPEAEDFFIISSHSGCNGAPVEMAMQALARGLPVLAITSLEHSRVMPSRHPSGMRLFEVATQCIDTCAPFADTAIPLPMGAGVCSVSSFAGVLIAQALTAEVVRHYLAAGEPPPVLVSRNLPATE
ncbi:MAG TPA: sugar isomerase domain-containing protein [Acidimicrobiales bacterium]|nr:sugar isomerase domain-containing protein [Acidimicrobiales bacterium]